MDVMAFLCRDVSLMYACVQTSTQDSQLSGEHTWTIKFLDPKDTAEQGYVSPVNHITFTVLSFSTYAKSRQKSTINL